MQFHHHGYVSTDPRVQPAAGYGVDRAATLPDEVDVLIVGTGPAGMITAAQLAQFPGANVRIIERRPGRLAIGQADGIQCRTVETFQAFGFAEAITAEAYEITEMAFWGPDPEDPTKLIRTASPADDPEGLSEFPHLVVNQARVLDYFAEAALRAPGRVGPDYGWEFQGLEVTGEGDYPVTVQLLGTAHEQEGQQRTIRAKYVVGADGARSGVRKAIGCTLAGQAANHAWGVIDVLANSDFPDIRVKSAIQSASGGNILLIPREGGYLFRLYVDLGEVPEDSDHAVRKTPVEEIIRRASEIMAPYTLDVKDVAWSSVYEVGHRITDRFDDVLPAERGIRAPRVFITGDACHTHSAKAGQGMNVSMQDGYNIGWKLGHVLDGRAPESLLDTYSLERQVVAQNLIDFDKEWSTLMAKPAGEVDPLTVSQFYSRTMEFSAGFMTQYEPSQIVGEATHQSLATGFPLGKRFKSARVARVADTNLLHLGHRHAADGRYRIYVFADAAGPADASATRELAQWLRDSPESPIAVHTPAGRDASALLDIKVVYQRGHREVDLNEVPDAFKPQVGPFGLVNLENVFGVIPSEDIFDERGISREGAIVVVRPDQYVSAILPLTAKDELAAYFRGALLPAAQ